MLYGQIASDLITRGDFVHDNLVTIFLLNRYFWVAIIP
jgi:hypothetical protein